MSTANFGRQKSWLPSSSKPGSASSLISLAMPDDWLEGLPMPKSSGRAGSLKNLAKFPSVDRSRGLPSVPDFRYTFPLSQKVPQSSRNPEEEDITVLAQARRSNRQRQAGAIQCNLNPKDIMNVKSKLEKGRPATSADEKMFLLYPHEVSQRNRPSAAGPVRAMPQALEFSSKKSSPVVFEDLDDADYSSSFVHVPKVVAGLRPGHGGQGYTFGGREAFPLELNSAMDIRNLLFGSILKTFPPEWSKQGFLFSDLTGLKFGLIQHGGGPCGVLAALQAMTLRNLLFGSALYPKSDKGATFPNFDPSPSERKAALIAAMAEIFSKTSGPGKNPRIVMPAGRKNFSAVGMYKSDGITESLAVIPMKSRQDTVSFLMDHIGAWIGSENSQALILFVYSLILSRGIPVIKEDMDSPTNTLIASHGYSTQELVNLVLVGQAVSNVFDNDITLGDDVGPKGSSVMKLKGVHTRSDIGFLSLFEHYKSCQVGSNYKSPKYPVWVVCSESHYSVLFSGSKELSTTDWQWETNPKKFDLYYYDGLARQDHLIRLTVDVSSDSIRKTSPHSDLIPPLELCIRTKWPDARVEWNESEPIL